MKAAVYYESGPPEVFRYEEVPDPVCPPNGIRVQVQAISIEGGDILHRSEGKLTSHPHIVGYQCAGIIKEVGREVADRAPGQRAVARMLEGSHAEQVAVPAHDSWLVPEGMDICVAACVPIPFSTAHGCL